LIIDAHLHLFERQSAEYPRGVHPLYPPELRAPVEQFVDVMDRHRIDGAVVVPLDHHDDYVAMVLGRYPDRFRGVGVLDDADPDPVASTRRRHRELRLAGLRLGRLGRTDAARADELELFPVLRTLSDLGMVLWFYGPPDQLPLLRVALEELPALRVMLNHLGFCPTGYDVDRHGRPRIETALPPPTLDVVRQLSDFPGVSVMFSGHYAFSQQPPPFADLDATVRAIGRAFGLDRLAWASDWPWIKEVPGYGALLSLVDHFFPDASAAERAAVMGDNAARLVGFEPTR
jgi:predicted TIM-barrel fold metal-dependent hydrolase